MKNEFELAQPAVKGDPKSGSKRDHKEAYERASGKRLPELHMEPPRGTEYLIEWYWQAVTGLEALSYPALHAWSQVTGIEPQGWEVEALMKIDICRRSVS